MYWLKTAIRWYRWPVAKPFFKTISKFNLDLVLMDVMLSDMDGRAICKNIKENPETENLPVILISDWHDLAQSLK